MSELDPFDQPRRHLRRMAPPWAVQGRTVCGRALNDVGAWLTFDEAQTLIKKIGSTRSQFVFCQSCLLSHRHAMDTPSRWEKSPTGVVADWATHAGYRKAPDADQATAELRALAQLVEAHRDEYDAIVNGHLNNELADRRATKMRTTR